MIVDLDVGNFEGFWDGKCCVRMTLRKMFEPLVATIEACMTDLALIGQLRLGGGVNKFVHFEGPWSGKNGLAAGKVAFMSEFEVEGLQ